MTPREKAFRAKELLADPLFQAVMQDLRENIVVQLESTAMDDVTTHHEAALTLQLLQRIPAQLTRYVDEHTLAEKRAEDDSWVDRMRQKFRA